jgi:sugar/nucleoside kinase (ribokinase family)
MKAFQLYGLGNALVDVFVNVSDEQLGELAFERGSMRLVEPAEQKGLLTRFHGAEPRLVSGGSVANSTIAFTQLGGKAAFLGCVGDDRYGLFYKSEFDQLGVDFANPVLVDETTGTCVCLITPDAERTMRTCLAVSSHLAARHVDEARLAQAEWLFIEGYVFANPETGQGAIKAAIQAARKHGVKVAITCSEAFVVQVFGEPFFEALAQADLLFCNRSEACAVTGADNAEEAFARLATKVPAAVVTDGPRGAYVRFGGVTAHVPAFACEPVDLTGAGDMLAGSFLYGVTHGVRPDRAARAACYLAMKVITQVGARLHQGARPYWDEALAG